MEHAFVARATRVSLPVCPHLSVVREQHAQKGRGKTPTYVNFAPQTFPFVASTSLIMKSESMSTPLTAPG